ncbi:MAG: CpsD/CapB family tyrosine-protein kinase, partial [Pseudomonadota bacterium]
LAIIGGFAFAFGGAFLFEVLRPGFDGAEETEKQLAVQQVGSLPDLGDAGEADPLRAARWILAEPRSLYSEAVRSVQHAVQARMPGGVLLLASSLAGEGRTTLASNLATQYAISGQRTLLIDGDLRYGRLSNVLGIAQRPGLVDIVSGTATPSDAILRDGGTSLHVLGAFSGRPPEASPTELLSARVTADLIATLRNHFDVIIIDAPPVLPVADTRILSDFADAILMVVRWRQTARLFVKQALRTFGPNEGKVLGIIMSRVEKSEYLAGIGLDGKSAPKAKDREVA